MANRIKSFVSLLAGLVPLVYLFAVPATAGLSASTNLFNKSKSLLVLQVGSDWCESGDYVRKIFESEEFRQAFNGNFEFAVYDDMDFPTPEVVAHNERLNGYFILSTRLPAITCVSAHPRRVFAQIENIPWNITQRELLLKISRAYKAKKEADSCFKQAEAMSDGKQALECYGKAFELLSSHVGEANEKNLIDGALAYSNEWNKVIKLDADGKNGLKCRFQFGDGVNLVKNATSFRMRGDFVNGAKYIESLRAVPEDKLTLLQKQSVNMAEYALWRSDEARATQNRALLHKVFTLGRDTFWGQCAMGRMIISGEQVDKREVPAVELLRRPSTSRAATAKFPLESIKNRIVSRKSSKNFSEADKKAIVTCAVLRRIGEKGWEELYARAGSRKFINEFFGDRTWMEDFLWSGHCANWKNALLALESIVFQDGRRWHKGGNTTARRFMTALALEHWNKDDAFLADLTDAYRSTAHAKRLHKHALKQPVWQWRMALSHTHRTACTPGIDAKYDYNKGVAAQQRFLDSYANVSVKRYVETPWIERIGDVNCLGESFAKQTYYELWTVADEWIPRQYTPILGGTSAELSMFAMACGGAHGIASCTAFQHKHIAFTMRRPDGYWYIGNSAAVGTCLGANKLPLPGNPAYSYIEAHESSLNFDREARLNAERFMELAALSQAEGESPEDVKAIYEKACAACPTHYMAWQTMCSWMLKSKCLLSDLREFTDKCVKELSSLREPMWHLLLPYLNRVRADIGLEEYANEVLRYMPQLKQSETPIDEEGRFISFLHILTAPLEPNPRLKERVLMAALDAQTGTRDYFSQAVELSAGFMVADEGRMSRFSSKLASVAATGDFKSKVNFGNLIRSAADKNNVGSFQQFAKLQEKFSPIAVKGNPYPEKDFGGTLISKDALLRASSYHRSIPPSCLPLGLDASPFGWCAFHTNREKSPWALVMLDAPSAINGIVVVNKASRALLSRQVPLEIQVSADGSLWRTVYEDAAARELYRVNLAGKVPNARFVRVRRKPEVRNDYFHLTKILVYGNKIVQ